MAEELCVPDVGGRLIGSTARVPRHAQMQFVVTHHGGALGTLIVKRRLGHQSSCVKGLQQFVRPGYAKVGFISIHRQRHNRNLSPGCEFKAKKRVREPIWA
jgi:hypothetical protein